MTALALAAAACGAKPAPAPEPPPTPTVEAAVPAPTSTATAEAAPTASATAEAATSPPRQSSGRPPVLKSDPEEVTDTFGSSPGAKIEIGEKEIAIFRIPENALTRGVNITFKLDNKGKTAGGQVGKIYRVTAIIPPASGPTNIDSAGPPFELALPAGSKKDANLAIGTFVTDDKGREKISWRIIAPVKIDDATGTAHFELPSISDAYLHITTKPPSDGGKKP
jgi:hypothetical protein